MTPHLNRLVETVQLSGHDICFYAELTKIIPNYPKILLLIWSSVFTIFVKPFCGELDILTNFNLVYLRVCIVSVCNCSDLSGP